MLGYGYISNLYKMPGRWSHRWLLYSKEEHLLQNWYLGQNLTLSISASLGVSSPTVLTSQNCENEVRTVHAHMSIKPPCRTTGRETSADCLSRLVSQIDTALFVWISFARSASNIWVTCKELQTQSLDTAVCTSRNRRLGTMLFLPLW